MEWYTVKNFTKSFCGENDFQIWDKNHHNFGLCFQKSVLCCVTYSLLAISSAYYAGKRTRFYMRNRNQNILIFSRILISILSILIAIIQPSVLAFSVKEKLYWVDILASVIIGFSWFIHILYLLALRHHVSRSTRGPSLIIGLWVSTLMYSICSAITVWNINDSKKPNIQISALDINRLFFTLQLTFQVIYLLTLFPRGVKDGETLSSRVGERSSLITNSYSRYGRLNGTLDPFHLGLAEEVNFLSYFTFYWVNLLMKKGRKHLLNTINDLYELPYALRSDIISQKIQRELLLGLPLVGENEGSNSDTQEILIPKHQLKRALFKCFGFRFFSIGILKLCGDLVAFTSPLLLRTLIQYVDGQDKTEWHGYSAAAGLIIAALIGTLFNVHFNYLMSKLNIQIRASMITTIYHKIQNLSLSSLSAFTSGHIVNMMSTDTDRVVNLFPSIHALWSLPLQLIGALYLLYREINVAAFSGVGFAIVLILVSWFISKKIVSLSTKMMAFKDKRLNLISDLLLGIKEIKLNSWESLFKGNILKERDKELKYLKYRKYLDAACVYFWASTPILISFLAFGTYAALDNQMDAATIFTAVALFNMLITPLNALPWVVNGLSEAWVSINRIEKLIELEEIDYYAYYTAVEESCFRKHNKDIVFLNSFFSWKCPEKRVDNNKDSDSNTANTVSTNSISSSCNNAGSNTASNLESSIDRPDFESDTVIKDFSINVEKGDVVAVVGPVGSGKTALIHAVLGELIKTEGIVSINGLHRGFGLATQNPWLQNTTIKENILAGSKFELSRYNSVLHACALTEDLRMLPNMDNTKCGENGASLSGGQRSRVALARAVYQNVGIYLLDDILSNVDGPVASQIMTRCIHGILNGKTIILVTHHLHLLNKVNLIVQMENGRIKMQGPPDEILPFIVLEVNTSAFGAHKDNLVSNGENFGAIAKNKSSINSRVKSSKNRKKKRTLQETPQPETDIKSNDKTAVELEPENLETRSFGQLHTAVYSTYFKACGIGLTIMIFFSFFLMQFTKNFSDGWLAEWVSHSIFPVNSSTIDFSEKTSFMPAFLSLNSQDKNTNLLHSFSNTLTVDSSEMNKNKYKFLELYGALALFNSIFAFMRAFLFAYAGVKAARSIHKQLLDSVIHAKIGFFDLNSVGRILNRFSTDIYAVDDTLPFQSNIFFAQLFTLVGTIVITTYGVPWILLLYIPLMFTYYNVQQYYRHTSRDLRRIYALSLSPLYVHFHETLQGLPVIRAMRASHRFSLKTDNLLENNQRAQFCLSASSQWLNLRLQLIGVGVIIGVLILSLWQHHMSGINAGIVGLVMSYALTISGSLNGVVTSFTETERELISVERVNQYLETAVREGHRSSIHDIDVQFTHYSFLFNSYDQTSPPSPPVAIPSGWPKRGDIRFENVYLKYHDHNPYALRNVSFSVAAQEKWAIVGRTGAGKSSLIMALFRLLNLSKGKIFIDGVDIADISLKKLRTNLSIVSQNSALFSGTVQQNLDPRGNNLDTEIEVVVSQCHLTPLIERLGGFNAPLNSGKELSAGERQLFGIARALLSRSKIICIDEGTSSLDSETDLAIQNVIKESFKDKTLIVIVHRLHAVQYCQKVMVMNDGEVAEIGTVTELLEDKESLFYSIMYNNS